MTDPAQLILADLDAEFRETAWFSRIGATPQPAERKLAVDYFTKLGLKGLVAVWLHDLGAGEAVLKRDEPYADWVKAERDAAAELTRTAGSALGERTASEAVNRAMMSASDAAMAAAREIFSAKGHGDEALMRVAAGAAARAGGEYALVLLAGADPAAHAFAAKQRLFAAGRWPLVAIEDQFALL